MTTTLGLVTADTHHVVPKPLFIFPFSFLGVVMLSVTPLITLGCITSFIIFGDSDVCDEARADYRRQVLSYPQACNGWQC